MMRDGSWGKGMNEGRAMAWRGVAWRGTDRGALQLGPAYKEVIINFVIT